MKNRMVFIASMVFIFMLVSLIAFGATTLTLSWTAPYANNDDPASGPVASYELKYSGSPINPENFDAATSLTTSTPKAPGATETYTFTLTDINKYYFAIKGVNAAGSKSPISNVAVANFFPPLPILDLRSVGTR